MTSNFEQPEIQFNPALVSIEPTGDVDKQDEAEREESSESLESTSLDQDEDDLLFLSETLWAVPSMILDKLTPPEPKKVEAWNRQLSRYCQKKGINIYDYVFDELPLAIATLNMGVSMYQNYREVYGKGKQKTETQESAGEQKKEKPEKGAEDYEHWKEQEQEQRRSLEALVSASHKPEKDDDEIPVEERYGGEPEW